MSIPKWFVLKCQYPVCHWKSRKHHCTATVSSLSGITKASGSQSFVPGSHPSSSTMDMRCGWCFLTGVKQLYGTSMVFNVNSDFVTVWRIIWKEIRNQNICFTPRSIHSWWPNFNWATDQSTFKSRGAADWLEDNFVWIDWIDYQIQISGERKQRAFWVGIMASKVAWLCNITRSGPFKFQVIKEIVTKNNILNKWLRWGQKNVTPKLNFLRMLKQLFVVLTRYSPLVEMCGGWRSNKIQIG